MDLTEDQKALVRQWAAEGADVAEIQEKLRTECSITISYIETRFLLADLAVEIQDKETESDQPQEATSQSLPGDDDPLGPDEVLPPERPPMGGGNVSVTIDDVTPANALVSGKVKFPDGQSADWMFDQTGRLALNPTAPGYRPSQEDIQAFQTELQRVISQKGGM